MRSENNYKHPKRGGQSPQKGNKTMTIYSITRPDELRRLCNEQGWFTCGTFKQYEKLLYANEHGCPISEIATIIWLCSDENWHCRRDIIPFLNYERKKYLRTIRNEIGGGDF